jgi:hypothetical protein
VACYSCRAQLGWVLCGGGVSSDWCSFPTPSLLGRVELDCRLGIVRSKFRGSCGGSEIAAQSSAIVFVEVFLQGGHVLSRGDELRSFGVFFENFFPSFWF